MADVLGNSEACHPRPRATLQGERIPSAILKGVFGVFYFFLFLNVVLGLVSDGFRIVSDTRVNSVIVALHHLSV